MAHTNFSRSVLGNTAEMGTSFYGIKSMSVDL
jgi:hypothetical protein